MRPALLALALLNALPAAAGECTAASGPTRAALVELYTSEGCSSCPPAERWLGTLPAEAIAAGRIVPIALHVAYWDRLGWKDPFAKPEFLTRQRAQMTRDRGRYVYTPQVVVDGRDYRGWHGFSFERDVKAVNATPAAATIRLKLVSEGGNATASAEATLARGVSSDGVDLYLAIVESGLVSKPTAGENRGATLAHAHVARTWSGPIPIGAEARAEGKASASLAAGAPVGAVAFVQHRATGQVLQALALPGCR